VKSAIGPIQLEIPLQPQQKPWLTTVHQVPPLSPCKLIQDITSTLEISVAYILVDVENRFKGVKELSYKVIFCESL
jgi:hypothetical protein